MWERGGDTALQCVCVVGGGGEGVVGGLGGGCWLWGTMGQGSDFKVDFKAAGNRALKEWGALFERCDGGQGSKRGVGRQCAQELRGGVAHKYSRRRRRRLQRRCEGEVGAAELEGGG